MPRVLIISFSAIDSDPRVSRQIRALQGHFPLTVAGRSFSPGDAVEFLSIVPRHKGLTGRILGAWLLKTGKFREYYWGLPDVRDAYVKLKDRRFDLIIANDVETLPLALEVAHGAKVLLDAHEYSPGEFEDRLLWSFFAKEYTSSFLCGDHLSKTQAVMTVCKGIADEYARRFNIREPFLVLSTPHYQDIEPRPCTDRVRMIHHGKAIPSRRIELMIDMMKRLGDRFSLDLMLVGDGSGYLDRLKKMASSCERVRFADPVPSEDILSATRAYDIGVFLLPPVNFNYKFALPNKFFEFIQARLAVAIGPSPEMARYVRHYDCGVISRDFSPDQLAFELNRLNGEEISRLKVNAHRAARELCFEKSGAILLDRVRELLELP